MPLPTPDGNLPPIGPEHPWLAPLAGYSDWAFRTLCREHGAAVACTEMVSAKGLVYALRGRAPLLPQVNPGSSATEDLLFTDGADSPLVVQLFGAEPEYLELAAALLKEGGYAWLDLNMGCSVPKVVRTGAGAALLKDKKTALEAAKAVIRGAAPCPVGCKLRLGWDKTGENYLDLARDLEQAGVAWITLHPRYARQGFSGRADWRATEKLVQAVRIPILAGGDLLSATDGAACIASTGASGLMFARGAMQSPHIFKDYLALLAGRERLDGPQAGPRRLRGLVLRHAELLKIQSARLTAAVGALTDRPDGPVVAGKVFRPERHGGIDGDVLKMRGAALRYLRDFSGSKALRAALARMRSWDEFYALIGSCFEGSEACE